ncbi:MAG: hypothetical protein R3F65_25695 [bacterium]
MRLGLVIVAALLALGCGEDDGEGNPLLGIYAVEAHRLDGAGCMNAAPVVLGDGCDACTVSTPYFKVKEQSFFGARFLAVVECEAVDRCADAGDEDTVDLSGPVMDQRAGDGWFGVISFASSGGAACSYGATEYRLAPLSAGVVRLTRTARRNTPESPSGMLGEDECLALTDDPPPADTLECELYEELDARLVE